MKLSTLFSAVNGNTFVGIDTKTVPTLSGGKSNPMQGRVTKVMTGASVMVFQNKNSNGYENMVKRRLEKEGKNPESFSLGKRTWGTRVEGTPVVEHKGQEYLEVIFLKSGEVSYELDGKPVDKSAIVGLKEVEPSGQGGLDNTVYIRTFAKDSITKVKFDGVVVSM